MANTSDQIQIVNTVKQVFDNWSSMEPDRNDSLYKADHKTVLFDINPMQDLGWAAQKERLLGLFAEMDEFWIMPNPDLAANCCGQFAWVTATWKAYTRFKSGEETQLEGRSTFVLVKNDENWFVVHDHLSVPF